MSQRLAPGDRAPDVPLYAPSGDVVRTAELWAEGPAVIAFLRHFG